MGTNWEYDEVDREVFEKMGLTVVVEFDAVAVEKRDWDNWRFVDSVLLREWLLSGPLAKAKDVDASLVVGHQARS